jgi:hypothetical protein
MDIRRARVVALAFSLYITLGGSRVVLADAPVLPHMTPQASPIPTPQRAAVPHLPLINQVLQQLKLLTGATTTARDKRIVYVIAEPSSDATTQILYAAASSLQRLTTNAIVIPRADWSVNDLYTRCGADKYLGAIVIQALAGVSGTDNKFFEERGWSRVQALAEVWKCKPNKAGFPDSSTATIKIEKEPIPISGLGDTKVVALYPLAGLATYYLSNGIVNGRLLAVGGSVFAAAQGFTLPAINTEDTLGKAVQDFGSNFVASIGPAFCRLLHENYGVVSQDEARKRIRTYISQYINLTPTQSTQLDALISSAYAQNPTVKSVGCDS